MGFLQDKYELTRLRLRFEPFLDGFICSVPARPTPRLFNRTSAMILQCLDEGMTVGQTIGELQAAFPAAANRISADVQALVSDLLRINVIRKRSSLARHPHCRFDSREDAKPDGYFSVPDRTQIAVTSACNLRCRHCYVPGTDTSATVMEFDRFKEIVDRLDRWGIHVLELSGGEPFINPDFPQMIEYAASLDLSLIVFTNATLLDRQDIHTLVKHVPQFIVSIDGPEEYHDQFRGASGAFRKATQAIGWIEEAGGHVKVSYSVNYENLPYIQDVRKQVTEFGAEGFLCSPAAPVGSARNFRYTVEDYRKLIQACGSIEPRGADQSRQLADLPSNFACTAGKRFLYISPDGDVYPCPLFATSDFRVGQLPSEDIEARWHKSPVLLSFRRATVPETGPCKDCRSCPLWCRALKFYVTGNLGGPPPYCDKMGVDSQEGR